MLASYPASMVNQKHTDLGIPNRFRLKPSRFRLLLPGLANRSPGFFDRARAAATELAAAFVVSVSIAGDAHQPLAGRFPISPKSSIFRMLPVAENYS
jgi:hypothetical protein